MTAGDTDGTALERQIRSQPEELSRLLSASQTRDQVHAAAQGLHRAHRIWLVGTGTSLHAAELGASMLQEAGRAAQAVASMHFVQWAPIVGPQDGVIVITHTAETAFALAARATAFNAGLDVVTVTRQGAGFPDSIETTSKERSHWQRFWEDHGVQSSGVELVPNLEGPSDPRLEAALANPRLSVLGVIWNKVDDIMHGMQMQTAGMHSQVRLWALQGHLQQLLVRLRQEDFVVYLTADHGNVTATGIGIPREGVLVETRGKRARVYDRPEFREEVAAKFPDSIRWPNYGLPVARHVLLAGDLKAFADNGDEIVAHGGIALEEVIVPFVTITREDG